MKQIHLAILATCLVLGACDQPKDETAPAHGEDHAAGHGAEHERPLPEIDESGYGIASAMIRPPLGGRDVTAGYLDVVSSKDDAIVGAHSDNIGSIELHTHEMDDDGVMLMRQVDDVPLAAGKLVSFQPKGLHLMMFGVSQLETGDVINVTLEFASGAQKTVPFVVETPSVTLNQEN